jgi:hypothetical protein
VKLLVGPNKNFLKRCWVGDIEYLIGTIIKILINEWCVYVDPLKYSKRRCSIVDTLINLTKVNNFDIGYVWLWEESEKREICEKEYEKREIYEK